VIATDGNPIEPIEVASFYILAGERVDFVLNANQSQDFGAYSAYLIKVKGHADCCEENSVFQTASLRYNGSNSSYVNFVGLDINYNNSGPNQNGLV
jgi:FtsP/CotA-like multicopper oxidase with cupredoxin domain